MQNFMKINYGLNDSYRVEKNAIEQMISLRLKSLNNLFELKKLSTTISSAGDKLFVFLTIKRMTEAKTAEIINSIEKTVYDGSKVLIGTKPNNIEVVFD